MIATEPGEPEYLSNVSRTFYEETQNVAKSNHLLRFISKISTITIHSLTHFQQYKTFYTFHYDFAYSLLNFEKKFLKTLWGAI